MEGGQLTLRKRTAQRAEKALPTLTGRDVQGPISSKETLTGPSPLLKPPHPPKASRTQLPQGHPSTSFSTPQTSKAHYMATPTAQNTLYILLSSRTVFVFPESHWAPFL